MGKPDIAHVGYHRTGTNFLQKRVFPLLDNKVFRARTSGRRFFTDERGFDEEGARAYFESEQVRNTEAKPLLVSDERFTGTRERDDLSIPGKLKRLNEEMRVVVVLRAQPDIFRSLYHLHVKTGGSRSYEDFVRHVVAAGRCDYEAMVRCLMDNFGPERVRILLYEDLKRSPQNFIDEFCDFLGVDRVRLSEEPPKTNARESDAVLRYRRLANQKIHTGQPLRGWRRAVYGLGDRAVMRFDAAARQLVRWPLGEIDRDAGKDLILSRYAESNRRLSALIDRPLGDYGYPA